MKKLLLPLVTSLVLAGCSSSNQGSISYEECTYPDAPEQAAPLWLCEQPVEGIWIQAVGYSRKLAAGPGVMKDVAATEARAALSNNFSADIKAKLSRVTTDTTANGENVNSDSIENLTKNVTAMNLTFSRIYRTQVSPTGGMYVLVGLNEAGYKENVNSLVNQSVGNDDPELYRQFLIVQADQELDAMAEQLKQ